MMVSVLLSQQMTHFLSTVAAIVVSSDNRDAVQESLSPVLHTGTGDDDKVDLLARKRRNGAAKTPIGMPNSRNTG